MVGQVGPDEEPSLCDVGNGNAGSSMGKPPHLSGTHLSPWRGGDKKGKECSPHKVGRS